MRRVPERPDRGSVTVRTRGVAVVLGGRRVLDDVTLEVGEGQLVALLGPNGAGKTTLLRSLLGLVPLAAGVVEVAGLPVGQAWRQVGYVPQRHDVAWDFPLSVAEVVLTGATRALGWGRRPSRDDHESARQALEICAMAGLAHRPVGDLSGGQRQRVLIARALVTHPAVLLLDEPFTGVDVPSQDDLTDLLVSLSRRGTTIVMTTHDLVGAMAAADRVCLLNRTLVADAAPDELRRAQVWRETFGVRDDSPLLRSVGAA